MKKNIKFYINYFIYNFGENIICFIFLIITLLLFFFILFNHRSAFFVILGCIITAIVEIFIIEPLKKIKLEENYIDLTKDIIDCSRIIVYLLFSLSINLQRKNDLITKNANINFYEAIELLNKIHTEFPVKVDGVQNNNLNEIKNVFKQLEDNIVYLEENIKYIPLQIKIADQRFIIIGIIKTIKNINNSIIEMQKTISLNNTNIPLKLQLSKEINDKIYSLISNLIIYFTYLNNDSVMKSIYYPLMKHLFYKEEICKVGILAHQH